MASTGSEMAPRDVVGGRGGANAPGDGSTGSGGSQAAGNTHCNSVVLEESIISLLLKLHSQLSGALDSFSLDDETEGGLSAAATTATAGCSGQPYPSTSSGGGTAGKNSGHSQMMELDEPAAEGGSSSQQAAAAAAAAKAGVPSPGRTPESRIGDGPFFIGNLLRKIAALDESCASRIDEIRKQLWPNQRERQAEQKAREAREKEERTKRAKERQKKMMEEFANRQKRFMQMAMAEMAGGGGGSGADSSGMDACCDDEGEEADAERRQEERVAREQQAEAEAVQLREKEYTCIICNTSAPSTESNPIGLVVLVESSSVVGHRRTRSERLSLPLGADDRIALEQSVTLAGEFSRRIELLQWKFGPTSWFLSHNIGWEGGVHIQSCGHHVHLSCHDAYLRSLHTPRSPNNLNVELGEFFCPVCRQLANSVLPLSPALDRPAPLIRSPTPPHRTLVLELIGLFQESKRTPMASKFSEAMGRAMGNITACTQRNIKRYPVTLQSLFSFVISIARTNLEAEIIQRGGSLCTGSTDDVRYKPKRDCIVPLLHVLSLHVRLMINDDWPIRFKVGDDWPWHSWSRLAGIQLAYDAGRDASDIGRPPKAARPPSGSGAAGSLPADPVRPVRAPATQHSDELEADLAMAVVPSTGGGTAGRRRSHEDDSDEDDEDDDDDEDGVLCRLRRVASSIRGMLLPPPRSPGDEPLGNDALHSIANNRRQAASVSALATGAAEPTGAAGAPGAIATSSTKTAAATAASSIVDTETIPDLISDPTALMLKFILLAPLHLDQAYFTCIVKVMYNLLYYQIVLQLCTHLTDEECDEMLACYSEQQPGARIVKERGVPHIGVAMAFVLGQLDRCRHIRSDSILMGAGSPSPTSNDASLSTPCAGTSAASAGNSASAMDVGSGADTPTAANRARRVNLDVLEKKLQRLCLPFLRVAALLRHHIYHAEIPDIAGPHLEFARLVYFLELVTVSMDWDKFNASKALCFLPGTELALPKNWCDQLRNLRPTYESTRSLIVKQHIEWRQPRLLGLPREYERLFTYYHEQPCQKCKNVPKESSICLLCGTIVCIKQTCCKEQDCCEAVRHSISCGGGTGIFLVITSTYIIVIRGHRACLWGSLYLDDYDEEDRDLKRGKPLYLSEDRFNLLESQWLSHRFAHTKHNWVWHRDSL
uniref:E3 ubiquitin-protein ligase n=1 Tax=Anopheles atroparvus TaxID=41427 RepID=A0A182JHG2_ANOAO